MHAGKCSATASLPATASATLRPICATLCSPSPTRHHAAIVDPKRGGEVAARHDGLSRATPSRVPRLQLSALLMLRPGELRQMEWAWVDLRRRDADCARRDDEAQQSREGERRAARRAARAASARDLCVNCSRSRAHSRYVFPSLLTRERLHERKHGARCAASHGLHNDDMTAHGFRAMARTMIAERLGVAPEVIEAQLAHTVSDSLGRAYNRTQFLEQRREMMVQWADYLDTLRAA